MKKGILVLALLVFISFGAFAQMSAGGGLLFDLSSNNGVKEGNIYGGFRIVSFGGFVFFDAHYVEADVYFAGGSVDIVAKAGGISGSVDAGSFTQLGFSLLGKYPIEMGELTVFPLFGINYNIVLSYKLPNGEKFPESAAEWFSQFGFQAGAGLDYNLNDNLYLRASALLHLRLPMKFCKDDISSSETATLGIGPVIKVAIGYRL